MWSTVWDCIFDTLKTIYTVMNTIKIFDINNQFSISLWDLSIGIIVMGAILNLFINFTTPTMPDRWESGVSERVKTKGRNFYNQGRIAAGRKQEFWSRWTL